MKKAVLLLLCLFGTQALLLSNASATPMSLDISAGYNYDSVGTSKEITFATAKTGNRTLATILGGHNLANNGRAFTNTDSLTSGTAFPRYCGLGNYITSFTYDNGSGSAAVSNSMRAFASATGSTVTTVTASATINGTENLNYSDLNLLFVQNRSATAGTYQTTITAKYTDGTTAVSDTGAVIVGANAVGGTLGSAGVNNQGGLSNSTDSSTAVTNIFSSVSGIVTTGTSGNLTSVISSAAGSGTNLWELATPITLNSAKVLASITISVSATGAGNWNELVVFGADSTLPENTPPPATDPTEALNVTFDPNRLAAHPRLMITPATIPALKAFYNSPDSAIWRKQFNDYIGSSTIPVNTVFLTDATEAQREGLWRLPTAALAWVVSGNTTAFNNAVGFLQLYVSLPDWETSIERNSGMAAANNMVGVALAYDWLYNDLDPVFRETVRQKLLKQARALYYDGFLQENTNINAIYWQLDPLPNHRWHRDAGLELAVMASYTGDPSQNWLMNRAAAEMNFVNTWLPADGTSHESVSYQVFGSNHLMLATQAVDDCLGTHLLDGPFWQNAGAYRLQMELASFNNLLDFGDHGGGDEGAYNNYLLKIAAHNHDANLRSGILAMFAVQPTTLTFSWFSLVWDDSSLTGGNYQTLPLSGYYSDLGVGCFKDSWTAGGVAAMFKCSPLGGVSLNKYRDANGETYANVAHDDPDANSFILFNGDDNVAASDQYSQHKSSTQQNTILINGGGQNASGRGDNQTFSQPATSGSMAGMATSFPPTTTPNGATINEGEAASSYSTNFPGGPVRPQISRYRRLFVWSPNNYILSLDDLRSPSSVSFTWLVQGPAVNTINSALGQFSLVAGTHTCPFQLTASQALSYSTVTSAADNIVNGKSVSLNYKQLQASASGTNVQIASIFNAWGKTSLNVALQNITSTGCNVVVTGTGISDTYQWTFATSATTASSLTMPTAPAFTSAAPPATAFIGTPYNFSCTASGSPAPTFSVTAGALPPGLTLTTSGVLSGTPTTAGIYTGTVSASNGVGTAATQNFTITVNTTFTQWEGLFFSVQQMQQTNVSGPNANPGNDGTVNLLKYLFDINPSVAMGVTDRAALPQVNLTTVAGVTYLTLTYRQKPFTSGITVNLQTSADLLSWQTVTPDLSQTVGTAGNGDPIVQVGVIETSAPKQFIRLNVTTP